MDQKNEFTFNVSGQQKTPGLGTVIVELIGLGLFLIVVAAVMGFMGAW